MLIVTDTHVHLYPCYELQTALRNLVNNLESLCSDAVRAAFLVERSDCHYFAEIKKRARLTSRSDLNGAGLSVFPMVEATPGPSKEGKPTPAPSKEGKPFPKIAPLRGGAGGGFPRADSKAEQKFEIRSSAEENGLILFENDKPQLYLFSGRQIVTAERIEILALTVDIEVMKDTPAEDVVKTVLDAGGIPVLSWAPGKWFLGRKKVVRQLIDSFDSGKLLIGDSTLRPTVWAEPLLMQVARSRGFAVVAGSDPLPFSGEEKYMGTYASVLDGPFDPDKPVSCIRKILTTSGGKITKAGKRCGPLEVIRRLKRCTATKRKLGKRPDVIQAALDKFGKDRK